MPAELGEPPRLEAVRREIERRRQRTARTSAAAEAGTLPEPTTTAVFATCAVVLLVTGMTAAAGRGLVSVDALSSSPRRLAQGKAWLLVSNGLLAQRPIGLSLFSFALLSLFTVYLCGSRLFVASAAVGHVGSTLLAYAAALVAFAVDPGEVRGVLGRPDYGVSAIQAAWIGLIAATAWRRQGQTARSRVLVVLACLGITAFAWMVRPDLTVLDLDHLFAFAIGAWFAATWGSRATPALPLAALMLARRVTGWEPAAARLPNA
jgi:hypothetical protein